MEITTDIALKGQEWTQLIDKMSKIFNTRTNYMLYMLCLAIGIHYDSIKTESEMTEFEGSNPSVPRNVVQNNDKGHLDFMFQAAILTTKHVELNEEERLSLAFGEKALVGKLSKIAFLTQFANYGAVELLKQVGTNDIETMENIKEFVASAIEGTDFRPPDDYPDDILGDDQN